MSDPITPAPTSRDVATVATVVHVTFERAVMAGTITPDDHTRAIDAMVRWGTALDRGIMSPADYVARMTSLRSVVAR